MDFITKQKSNTARSFTTNDYDKALRGRYPLSNMNELGFFLIHMEASIHYFMGDGIIIVWNSDTMHFTCYYQGESMQQVMNND